MKLPETIKIGGRTYSIKFPHVFVDSCEKLLGQCDDGMQIIRISDSDGHGSQRHFEGIEQTLIHEILHAIDFVYLGGKMRQIENYEDIIDQLAEGISQVFRDNNLWRPKCGK